MDVSDLCRGISPDGSILAQAGHSLQRVNVPTLSCQDSFCSVDLLRSNERVPSKEIVLQDRKKCEKRLTNTSLVFEDKYPCKCPRVCYKWSYHSIYLPVLAVCSYIPFEFVVESSKDVSELIKLSIALFLESFFCIRQFDGFDLQLFLSFWNFCFFRGQLDP